MVIMVMVITSKREREFFFIVCTFKNATNIYTRNRLSFELLKKERKKKNGSFIVVYLNSFITHSFICTSLYRFHLHSL